MFLAAARHLLGGVALPEKHGLAQLALRACELPAEARARLQRAAAHEAAEALLSERESKAVLRLVSSLRPVVLKGVALAARWPEPRLRPAGDLDLLIEKSRLSTAVTTLCDHGFRVVGRDGGGRMRAAATGVDLVAPQGRFLNVDLHTRLFRSVGGRVDAASLLARASADTLLGEEVRRLDAADEVLFLLVHAAKHGACALKWLLDLWLVTQRFDRWPEVVELARSAGVTRAAWAAARLVAELPGAEIPALDALRPALLGRWLSQSLVTVSDQAPRWQGYARELVLEESLWRRLRMLGGVAERVIRRG